MERESNREALRNFLGNLLGPKHDILQAQPAGLNSSPSTTRAKQSIDSLNMVELVLYLESEFGVDFSKQEFIPEELHSIEGILDLIERSQ